MAVQHHVTREEAIRRLENAVAQAQKQFGHLVNRIEWSPDHTQVCLSGLGCEIDLRVDDVNMHVKADLLGFGKLLARPVTEGLKQIVQRTFPQSTPPKGTG